MRSMKNIKEQECTLTQLLAHNQFKALSTISWTVVGDNWGKNFKLFKLFLFENTF